MQKPDAGPCRAAFTMFYYDPDTNSCQPFVYGGCRGNDNRYDSREECLDRCHSDGKGCPTQLACWDGRSDANASPSSLLQVGSALDELGAAGLQVSFYRGCVHSPEDSLKSSSSAFRPLLLHHPGGHLRSAADGAHHLHAEASRFHPRVFIRQVKSQCGRSMLVLW